MIPDTVTGLGCCAFYGCSGLNGSVRLSDGLTQLEQNIFNNCENISAVEIPDGIMEIGNGAFCSGEQLTIYGIIKSVSEEYAQRNANSFIPLNYPLIDTVVSETAPGKEVSFTAKVYTGINKYITDVSWAVNGNASPETTISTEGVLKVAADENADIITVSATWKDSTSEVEVAILREYYTIAYHLDGGENDPSNPDVYPATDKTLRLLPPTKDHYDFAGWFMDDQLETPFTEDTEWNGDLDLFAKWSPVQYTLTFDVNGGNDLEENTREVTYNESYGVLPQCTRDGYDFVGWFLDKEGSDAISEETICEGDLTVYAHWMEKAIDHEHEYEETITKEPSCTEDGLKSFKCKFCDSSYEETIPATGHVNTEVRGKVDASCTSEGYTGDLYCKDCGELLEEGKTEGKTDHAWDEGKITKEASCSETGIRTYTCSICEEVRTEEIPMTKHDWGEWATKTGATCIDAEVLARHCGECGAEETKEGQKATGHQNTETRDNNEASCAEEGYSGDTYCMDCGTLIQSGSVISKLSHTWDEGAITIEPTAEKEGEKTYTCTTCGETRKEPIAKLEPEKQVPAKPAPDPVLGTLKTIGSAATKISENGDLAGSAFSTLQYKAKKAAKTSITFSWKAVPKAAGYVIYGARCGSKYGKLAVVKGTSYKQSGLKKGTYYKYFISAYDKHGNILASSRSVHIATSGGKVGNTKSVKLNKKKVSLKKGKKFKLKATLKNGKLKVKKHRKVAYESSNPKVATVSGSGKIKAVGKGTCYIFAYAQNGVFTKCKVTVK